MVTIARNISVLLAMVATPSKFIRSFKPKERYDMCSKCKEREMAGVHRGHLEPVKLVSSVSADLVSGIHAAITENLNPHLPVFAALVAMAEAVKERDYGVLGDHRLVRLPLSIIGTDKVRYRTEMVERLHESILSFRMSEISVETLRKALKSHGLCVLFLCSCGVVMGRCEDVRSYYGSEAHRRMDRLRSAIDAEGNPVVEVASLADISVATMDLHGSGAEARLFRRIEDLTRFAARAGRPTYDWLDAELRHFMSKTAALQAAA